MSRASRIVTALFSTGLLAYALLPRAHATLWPVVTEVRILDCKPFNGHPCGSYALSGTAAILEQGTLPPTRHAYMAAPGWYGVHCDKGDKDNGFSICGWNYQNHGPTYARFCVWADTWSGTWDLSPSCTTPATWAWSRHSGAAPGGECSVFGVRRAGLLITPWGELDPTQVANSGSAHCVKPGLPTIPCMVGTPGDLDHGSIDTNTVHTTSQDVVVSCGERPTIQVVGGPNVELSPGVTSQIHAGMTSPTTLRVESRLTNTGGTPGRYSVSKIIVVAPE